MDVIGLSSELSSRLATPKSISSDLTASSAACRFTHSLSDVDHFLG